MGAARNPARWMVRAELELADIRNGAQVLPPRWSWSNECFWVVNSDGVAVDPLRRLVRYGGMVHTATFATPHDLAAACEPLFTQHGAATNYRSSMRIGVFIPGLAGDLAALRQIADYTRRHLPPLWAAVDPLTALFKALPGQKKNAAAAARMTATTQNRHFLISERQHQERMAATSAAEFKLAGSIVRMPGQPAAVMNQRECVDLHHAGDTGWVTLRCFPQPGDAAGIYAAASFAIAWLLAALSDDDPQMPVLRWMNELPRQLPFDPVLEKGWAHTNLRHHSRRTVAARLMALDAL